ncbi:MAG TPA: hypothetical protein IAD18_00185 [Candidatus Limisoma intestinavium]|uniref:Uncharacterized protein n=1 Tax=Candidatus Limisoma intestinavium TaxID=2840856 RepID=A0A9D1IJG1_9BACT|nr:hypothetical protein [Candidatus Limisoma intestinavium]
MNNKLYRILNEEEPYDILYASYINQSVRKNEAIKYARNYWKGLKANGQAIEALTYGEYSFNKSDNV